MSALPTGRTASIPSQDETHHRIHELLSAVVTALLDQQPGLLAFHDHRSQRDRSSGSAWHGLQTLCHVSALLVSVGVPEATEGATPQLLEAVHEVAVACGMQRRSEHDGHGMAGTTWADRTGNLLEVVVGVRTAVRAISAPFLPGSLSPMATTSPASALSPLTPPPRGIR